jgi:translation initiation factor 2B subunit (eIF-2B alpha/beta/delta family)
MPQLTIAVQIPALDRLVEFLKEERDDSRAQTIASLTERLRKSAAKLSSAQQSS